jgi:hypothetical protein
LRWAFRYFSVLQISQRKKLWHTGNMSAASLREGLWIGERSPNGLFSQASLGGLEVSQAEKNLLPVF